MDSVTTEVLGSVTIDGPGSVMIASLRQGDDCNLRPGDLGGQRLPPLSASLFCILDRPGDLMICNSGDSGGWFG